MASTPEVESGLLATSLAEVLARRITPAGRIWVGFSGGMDSCVLLHLLAHWWQQQGGASLCAGLHAIHVHHGLMAEADEWVDFCQQQCQQLGIPLVVERVTLGGRQDGLEQAARQARYEVFQHYCQEHDWLLLGHHADDQVETLFSRLTRGSGLGGLGMPQVRYLSSDGKGHAPRLLRPLLACSRQQLRQYAQTHQLNWIEDPSNQDTRLERNWWRQHLLPQLSQRFPGREHSLKRTVRRLAADKSAFDHLLAPVLAECVAADQWPGSVGPCLDIQAWQGQAAVLHEPLLFAWLQQAGVDVASEARLGSLVKQALYAAADAQVLIELGDVQVRRFRGRLHLVQTERDWPITPATTLVLTDPGVPVTTTRLLFWSVGELVLAEANRATPAGIIRPGEYQLTNLLQIQVSFQAHTQGSNTPRLRPPGRPSKSLKQLWQEAGIPPWLRPHWPLLLQQKTLVAVVGVACDQAVAADADQGGCTLLWQSGVLCSGD
ncbi:tRNA lysidine(34) synthetase TilS [Oceanobacter sp. 5_MG-2023]|uniref:tRNA lysidine(34) synthetase TilS n=1 Tax=Oceanobacter sp. 5_MG-2023 TaxID=3062645 RepID=UPI0026E29A3A|nr:tRNA lysidine(34) synthetase TilS [Oceanobacter sp. 5_MG-2023]MDO6681426.1 tRNA lysidine(34) synthetase TilS [Oceanobacter sp. 5_MG-2023]